MSTSELPHEVGRLITAVVASMEHVELLRLFAAAPDTAFSLEMLSGALRADLRFWRISGDRLFLFFASAFGLLVVQRLGLTWVALHEGQTFGFYLLRLAAFLVLLAGIIDKNRG